MSKIFSFFVFSLCVWKSTQGVAPYNVALVEYLMDDEVVSKLSPLDLSNRNARKYSEIVRNIKEKNNNKLDLVLFPESTLNSKTALFVDQDGLTFVPSPEESVIPCNTSSVAFASFFKLLSCTAQKYETYLVVNLKEKYYCKGDVCESNQLKRFNTDVVFDRTGKVVARYRKYNLFGEFGTSTTKEPELITFETDFGITFGIFTCFDILFQSPPIDLIKKGVRHFLFPTYWFPELPFLSTIQSQQMWSQGTNVTLLTASAAHPKSGSGGLGIFHGLQGNVATVVSPYTDNRFLLREVPDINSFNSVCSTNVNDDKAKEMDQYELSLEDLSDYSHIKLDIETSKTIKETLCQQQNNISLCCEFTIEADVNETKLNDNKNKYNYYLAVRSGYRTHAHGIYRTSMEICSLLACTGDSISTCGERFPNYDQVSWPLTFNRIEISAQFPNTEKRIQFPNSLLADFSPIQPSCTIWKSEENDTAHTIRRTFASKAPVTKLLTYAIYGRNFALD
ncbi:hypothetical protein WA026_006230 [Henosepilachna vigintioctopunctata]|uniref:CN hydrolase domain-containing protein n=1 Tax=Henosepilachna vigintioctopunctata TaxID=420089 RepID=A0AAW1TNZ9_9CUCU